MKLRALFAVIVTLTVCLPPDAVGFSCNHDPAAREESADSSTKSIRSQPKNARAYLDRANAYLKVYNHSAALKDSEKAIELDPNLAEAYLARGLANYAGSQSAPDHLKSLSDFNKAISLNPRCILAYVWRANCIQVKADDIGTYYAVIDSYATAIKLDRKAEVLDGYVFCNLLSFYFLVRQHQKAIDLASYILKNDFPCVRAARLDVILQRASAYRKLGQQEKAIADYSLAVKEFPADPRAYGERAEIFFDLKHYEQVINDCNQAIALKTEDYRYYFICARANGHLGQHAKDVINCSIAIKLHPPYANPTAEYFERASAHLRLGQIKEALSDCLTACQMQARDQQLELQEYLGTFFCVHEKSIARQAS